MLVFISSFNFKDKICISGLIASILVILLQGPFSKYICSNFKIIRSLKKALGLQSYRAEKLGFMFWTIH